LSGNTYVATPYKEKIKKEAVLVHAKKACVGSGGIASLILNLDTKFRRVVNFTPRPLLPRGKNPSIH
jgi:hypothetical protein